MNRSKTFLVPILVLLAVVTLVWLWQWRREHRFDAEIEIAAAHNNVDEFLLKAVVWRESRFNPNAESRKGALGLAQVTPAAGYDWAKTTGHIGFHATDLFQPAANLDAGAWYLARAIGFWSGRGPDATALALSEYNAGRQNVLRWMSDAKTADQPTLERIGFPVTRGYVTQVLAKAEKYRQRGHL